MGRRFDSEGFSVRQRSILELAAEGRADREIAARLGISVHTVDAHWRRLRERYGAASRTQVLSLYTEERASLRIATLDAELDRLAREVEALKAQRDLIRAARREQLESLTRQQNEIISTIGELMVEADIVLHGLSVFRSFEAFRAAAPQARDVDLRPHVVPGTNEVRPEGMILEGIRFEGRGDDPYLLCLMDWPRSTGWAHGPAFCGDRPRGIAERCLRISPPPGVHFLGFAFHSRTRHEVVPDVWRFSVETATERYELKGTTAPEAPGFIGIQAAEPIVTVEARCGDICFPQIARVVYAGFWIDDEDGRSTMPVGPA